MLPSIMTVRWLAVVVIHPINMKSPSNQLGYTGQDFKAKAKLGSMQRDKSVERRKNLLSIDLIEMKQYPRVTSKRMVVVISNGYESVGQHGHAASSRWSLETLGR